MTLWERKRRKAAARNKRMGKRQLKELEKAIHKVEEQLRELEADLSDPELYRDGEKAR